MVVQHNLTAMNANRQLGVIVTDQAKSTEKLSSGYRINRAGDDAAGLSISEKMRNQVRGLDMASKNCQDGISLIQTAEGALQEVHSILQRMGELATQAANDTNVTEDRSAIKAEIDQLSQEITRISTDTQFNKMDLLTGDYETTTLKLQVGANANQKIEFNIEGMSASDLGVDALEVDDYTNSNTSITAVQSAIEKVSNQRSDLGALQNRLEHTINNVDTASENLQAAESRIRDTDMAAEMVKYSKNSILQQAAQSMLAQANQSNQGVLALLQ